MTEEQVELMRRAAQSLIDHHTVGRRVDPDGLAWARRVVERTKPLARHVGPGANREDEPHGTQE